MDSNSPIEQFSFTPDFQNLIAATLIRDPATLPAYRHLLKPGYFADNYVRQIIEWTLWYFDTYAQTPVSVVLKQIAAHWCASSKHLQAHEITYSQWIDYLHAIEINDSEYVTEQLYKFAQQQEYAIAIKTAYSHLKNGQADLVPKIIEDVQAKLALSQGDLGLFSIGMDAATRHKELFFEKPRHCVETDWPSINKICGGPAKKELFIIAAPPNRGKSYTLCAIAAAAVKRGKKVVYYSLEMSRKLIALRVYSILTGMTEAELASNDALLEQTIQQYRQAGGECVVIDWPPGQARVNDIRNHLLKLRSHMGHMPDMAVVDYPDELAGAVDTKGEISEVTRHILKRIYTDLRGIAVRYDIAMVAASQTNKSSLSKEIITIGDLAECFGKAAIADVIFALCQTEEEEQGSPMMMRLFNAKNRNAKKGGVVQLSLNFAQGRMIEFGSSDLDVLPLVQGTPFGNMPLDGSGIFGAPINW